MAQVGIHTYIQSNKKKYRVSIQRNGTRYQKRGFLTLDEAVAYKNLLEKKIPEKIVVVDSSADICHAYLELKSIKATSKKFGVSRGKVRKIITESGLYDNERAKKVSEMIENGESRTSIAKKLKLSKAPVHTLSPYERGEYKKQK